MATGRADDKKQDKDQPATESAVSDSLLSDDFYMEVIGGDNALPVILGTHLAVEHLLIEWLALVLPDPRALFPRGGLRHHQILRLSNALGLIGDDLAAALHELNRLRNGYAHRLRFGADREALSPLFRSFQRLGTPLLRPDIDLDSLSEFDVKVATGASLAFLLGHLHRKLVAYKESSTQL